ncbi:hypothetical protein [Pararhodobacter zhoushanensis]|uniref:hypothetical protein n=1 Tax=Pararhodobacter zhoushanensis TaxID=2479545 RepID=UPI000F8CB6D8|nr:hypothetical protein [Pararhodobacter zhoushanensis]
MRFLLPLLLAASPALAEGQRDAFTCDALMTCIVNQPCTDGGEGFGLAFLGGGLEIEMGGTVIQPVYDGTLQIAAWERGTGFYQLRLTGDGGGLLTLSMANGASFEETTVLWLHCSPQ